MKTMLLTAWLTIYVIQTMGQEIELDESIEELDGYDCSTAETGEIISLRTHHKCEKQTRNITTTSTHIQLISILDAENQPVMFCKVEIKVTGTKCGASPRVNLKLEEIFERRGNTIKKKIGFMKRIESKVQNDIAGTMNMLRANEEKTTNDMREVFNQPIKEDTPDEAWSEFNDDMDEVLAAVSARNQEDREMMAAIKTSGGKTEPFYDGTE